jgi:hypothetical protein
MSVSVQGELERGKLVVYKKKKKKKKEEINEITVLTDRPITHRLL